MECIQTGLERFLETPPDRIAGKRLGLLSNPASINSKFAHSVKLIANRFPGMLTALYSPQHGFYAEKQDNMVESYDTIDTSLGIPIFSLYGKTRIPSGEMFDPIDVLVIDLQDVGTRVYTFIYTMSYCLEAAKKYGKKVIVLDRPNPLNGIIVEGNCLAVDCVSFVGRYPIPMRHGLTIGEVSLLFNNFFGIGCDLEVVSMKGWKREMLYQDTGLPWVPPSPNLPTPVSAMVYPGQVLWEGTNISEGRGTTQPFELFGAPFLDTEKILFFMGGADLPGALLREVCFEPTSNKWNGEQCHGFQIHITDPELYRPYITSLRLMEAVIYNHGKSFQWKTPPYEYEHHRFPIDLISGDTKIRKAFESRVKIDKFEKVWANGLENFNKTRRRFYLY